MSYNLCWAKAKRLAEPKPELVENYAKTLSDIELLNIIETNIHQNPNNTLDMNFINETYINILLENSADPKEVSNNYKKQLKELISVNLPDLLLVKSTQKNKPEQLISPSTQASALNAHMDSIADEIDLRSLLKFAKKIRVEVLEQKWEFEEKFTNYKMPALLSTFMKWVLLGPHTMNSEDGETYQVNNIIKATLQFVSQNIKTVRQTTTCKKVSL